jgi:peptidyl-prolyl cis-trans isomerase SurA
VLTADPRDAVLSLKQISLTFPKGTTEKDAAAKAAVFASTVKTIHGCGEADAAAKLGASVVTNDQVKARDLPAALQDRCSSCRSAKSPRRSARSRTACAC